MVVSVAQASQLASIHGHQWWQSWAGQSLGFQAACLGDNGGSGGVGRWMDIRLLGSMHGIGGGSSDGRLTLRPLTSTRGMPVVAVLD